MIITMIRCSFPPLINCIYLFYGSDFLNWKRDVLMALTAKNKDGFLTGDCAQPSSTDKKHSQWIRCDLMVLRWLMNSIAKSVRDNVLYARSSKELWTGLLERYGQLNALELYQLKKDLSNISQNNSSLIDYYSSLKRNWECIDSIDPIPDCSCGALKLCTCQLLKFFLDRDTHSKLIQLLMGLNSSYETVKTHLLSMDLLPPINKALGLLQKIERQQTIHDIQSDSMVEANAYVSFRSDQKKPHSPDNVWTRPRVERTDTGLKECSHCFKRGHVVADCFKLKTCGFCNIKGHIKEHCFKFKALNAKGGVSPRFQDHSQKSAHSADVLHMPYCNQFVANNPLDDGARPSSVPQHHPSGDMDLNKVLNSDVV
ncbi:hypothetical protein RND81_11G142600 [Saponaria officinalis]|uniref:Retrotransposon gag domain-containing protein n=1 Tax=Saponaria officinalis TaxID=3572 RepID=A0AAW1HLY2_SAPOF